MKDLDGGQRMMLLFIVCGILYSMTQCSQTLIRTMAWDSCTKAHPAAADCGKQP